MSLLVGGLTSVLLIISLLFFKMRSKAKNKQRVQRLQQELIQTQLQNKALQAEQLQQELAAKHADLTNLALDIGRKNIFSNQLNTKLKVLQKSNKHEIKSGLNEIVQFLNNHLRINEDLALLQENINHINQSFYQKLDARFGNLTANDKYILGLIRLNLSNKDVANIKGISPDSAKVLRYRLRKKLRLTPKTDLVSFLQNL